MDTYPSQSSSPSKFDFQSTNNDPLVDTSQDKTNHELLQEHEQIMQAQDQALDVLSESIGRQKEMGLQLGNELEEHVMILEETEGRVQNTQNRLAEAGRRLNRFAEDNGGGKK